MDSHQQKISHLKALYYLACIDNELSATEANYILKVAEHLGIGPAELKDFDIREPELELPNREYKLYSMFHRLAIILMVDGTLQEVERQYCFNLGIKMGLHPNAVKEIVDLIGTKGPLNALPSEIMGIFKKYLN